MENERINPRKGEIILYQTSDGSTSIDVKLENDTVWLTQDQLCVLFEKDKTDISRHLKNIFDEGELDRRTTVAKFATVVQRGFRGQIEDYILHYNLDVIISVGYRVKSKRATAFRIWASSVLKEYLIKGYVIRNNLAQEKYEDLKTLVEVVGRTMGYLSAPVDDQVKPIFDVVKDYTFALDTLDDYDYKNLNIDQTTAPERFHATYENAMEAIRSLKNKFGGSDLFGVEKDESFHSSIGQIYQTFDEGCLKAVFRVYQMDYPDYEFHDTLCASRRYFGYNLPNHQLQTVAAACGYDLTQHHHALADAEACAAIALRIL